MAKYRPTYSKIWNDPDFQRLTKEQKLLFIYFFTNPETTESGIYPISPRSISNATGINIKTVIATLKENEIKNISYDFKTNIIFVHKFLRYNGHGSQLKVIKAIANDIRIIKSPFWENFATLYPESYEKAKQFKENETPNPNANPIPDPIPTLKANHTHLYELQFAFMALFKEKYGENYLPAGENEEIDIAERLYRHCQSEHPEDPIGYFEIRAKYLINRYAIKQFSGLLKYWNAGAENVEEIGQ